MSVNQDLLHFVVPIGFLANDSGAGVNPVWRMWWMFIRIFSVGNQLYALKCSLFPCNSCASLKVIQLLKAGKAKEVSYNALASHIISEDGDNPEVGEAREVFDLPVVKVGSASTQCYTLGCVS